MTAISTEYYTIREATLSDATALARLFMIASDGLAEYIWRRQCPHSDDFLTVGAENFTATDNSFSYLNCEVASVEDRIIAYAHSYPMGPDGGSPDPDPAMTAYSELEQPNSLYLEGLAVDPAFRGLGIGQSFMRRLESRARRTNYRATSLLCFEANYRALKLYRSLGYEIADRRPLFPLKELHYDQGDVLLMVKKLT